MSTSLNCTQNNSHRQATEQCDKKKNENHVSCGLKQEKQEEVWKVQSLYQASL